jgi:hypothetical protein
MNTQDQIIDKDAEKESAELSLEVADKTFHADYEKSDGKIEEEELKALLDEVKLTPPDTKPVKVLTPEQQKQIRVYQSAQIFKGGLRKEGNSKIGVTRANKKLSKKAEKTAKKSRKISRGK